MTAERPVRYTLALSEVARAELLHLLERMLGRYACREAPHGSARLP